jgi:signal transduction histidine kinase/DNA-binding response OmpR family regulator
MDLLKTLNRLYRLLPYGCLVLSIFVSAIAKPVTPEEGKVTLLAAILQNTTWPQEEQIHRFVVGLFGQDRALLQALERETPTLKVRGKRVDVSYYHSLSAARQAHMLVVASSRNSDLTKIVRALDQSHTLIVTDGSKDQQDVMINFTHPAENILTFEVNRRNVLAAGLELSKEILLFGGTEVDKDLIYRETEAELARAKELARQQQQELQAQQKLFAEQEEKIQRQNQKVADKELELELLEKKLGQIETTLAASEDKLFENQKALEQKESLLAETAAVLEEKEAAIAQSSAKIDDNLALIDKQQADLQKQERLIAEKNEVLIKQLGTIENQQFILVAAAIVLAVVLSLIAIIFRSYRIKKRINLELEHKTEELKQANEKLVTMTAAKSQFLSTMSHEIRTPLNGVTGIAELLQSTELTKQQAEYVKIILKSADTLLSLINDILDIAKIEAGKLELENIPFNLRDTLGDTMQTLAIKASEKKLELAFHIPPDVPENLKGDPVRLRQIVVNLVGNAIKFTEEGEVVVDMKMDAMAADKIRLAFEVRDTGIGISEDQRNKIFEAFGQADSTTTRQYGGTGLGLTIASELVAKMGGQLAVSSEPGKGSTFSFSVEFKVSQEPAKISQPPTDLKGKRVLIVDDNSTNRMILEEMMSSWGMEVRSVGKARDALAILEDDSGENAAYAMAILDVMMPEMDGFELAEKIRDKPSCATMRILILSSAGFSGNEQLVKKLDISRTLLKPVKHSDLLVAITDALGVATAEDKISAVGDKPDNFQSKKVLLVEDGVINQKVATDLLVKRGHRVELAENGEEAYAAVCREKFDLVLMDVQMPVMDGLAATRKIRDYERSTQGHIPIIAMTAGATTEDRNNCMAAGMDDYVSKPFRAAELFRAVESPVVASVESQNK